MKTGRPSAVPFSFLEQVALYQMSYTCKRRIIL